MSVPRDEIADRLRARRAEIEHALLARASAVPDTSQCKDPEYLEGFRAAVGAAFDYSLAVIESGEGESDPPPIPAQILTQARLAARNSVGLDSVLRRYVAGSALLDDLLLDAIEGDDPQSLLRSRAIGLELLLSSVSSEYERERRLRGRSRSAQMVDRVRQMLRGELAGADWLDYNLDASHIGMVAHGKEGPERVREVARTLDCRPLIVCPDDRVTWAWLGRTREIEREWLTAVLSSTWPREVPLAVGEPSAGVSGWRQTHRQARAALPVSLRKFTTPVHYSDVCLLASMMQDDLLTASLREIYMQPLRKGRDGGDAYLQTLRAYFASGCNGSTTARALGVTRQTVASRLRVIEDRLGRRLSSCATAVETALHLDDLDGRRLP